MYVPGCCDEELVLNIHEVLAIPNDLAIGILNRVLVRLAPFHSSEQNTYFSAHVVAPL